MELKELQKELFEMLVIVDNILKENKFTYFLLGGSALGAVRHKGFIPWDDDIDIGLYRRDFEKVEIILKDKLPKNMIYYKVGEVRESPIGRIKNIDKGVKGEFPTIDIFPLDNVPNNKIMEKIQNLFAEVYHLCIYRKTAKNRGKFAYFFTKCILQIFPNFLLNFLEKISKKIIILYKDKDTKYINNFFGMNYEKVRKEVMEKSVLMEFEKKKFPIPILYDEYLTTLYGEYMKIPDKEKQKPKHKNEMFS